MQKLTSIPTLLVLLATGLLGSNPAAGAQPKKILVGKLSPLIDGLYYETQTQKGYTAKGKFRYRAGESVTSMAT